MFTGLIDDVGVITNVRDTPAGRELTVSCRYQDLVVGESIACNGACLTVRTCEAGLFTVAAVVTSLERTAIAAWREGTRLNLERAMALGDRLGGHLVQGHVDAVGQVVRAEQRDDAWLVDIAVPPEVDELLVPHGSITVDGVSLTVNAQPAPGVLQVSVIAHTLAHTTLGSLVSGSPVHLESDILGKFVRRLLQRPPAH